MNLNHTNDRLVIICDFRETPKLTPRDHYLRTSRYLPGQVTRINSNNNNVNDLFGSRQNSSVKSSKFKRPIRSPWTEIPKYPLESKDRLADDGKSLPFYWNL